jgi:hypothetical protein
MAISENMSIATPAIQTENALTASGVKARLAGIQ